MRQFLRICKYAINDRIITRLLQRVRYELGTCSITASCRRVDCKHSPLLTTECLASITKLIIVVRPQSVGRKGIARSTVKDRAIGHIVMESIPNAEFNRTD